ncbi:acetoacetate decarboxylase family protein [Saccharopolyspora thermophila]|uniref:acetoacetate decarboxylase family protein n=1 Tax=Saccharopolyspora thermophila TaxID=89367 RepID=UPI001E6481E7|nr:acetoacetate decarboxylase family protein [Saccharopolyspora subtropica]
MSHLIQGERVTMPVRIRDASACAAMFTVPARRARSVLSHAGLDPVEPVRGTAVCALAFVHYRDGDLGSYHEFAVAFLVRDPVRRGSGAFIHWLPVDQTFTLAAGRTIWGFPKEMADIDLRLGGRTKSCVIRQDGRLVAGLLVKPGIPVPSRSELVSLDAYTHQDGVLRRIPWKLRAQRVRSRPGGALLRLGDHPVARELASLGLPKTALCTSSIGTMAMTVADADVVG